MNCIFDEKIPVYLARLIGEILGQGKEGRQIVVGLAFWQGQDWWETSNDLPTCSVQNIQGGGEFTILVSRRERKL